jgi:hypothetical protein
MTRLALPMLVMLIAQSTTAVWANDDRYRPVVTGTPAGTVVGTLVGYGQGNAAGILTVRRADGKTIDLYAAKSPFVIDGRRIACTYPPRPPEYRLNPAVCFVWPSYVKIGVTRVSVPYWKGTRYGKPTLIARGLTVVK